MPMFYSDIWPSLLQKINQPNQFSQFKVIDNKIQKT